MSSYEHTDTSEHPADGVVHKDDLMAAMAASFTSRGVHERKEVHFYIKSLNHKTTSAPEKLLLVRGERSQVFD